MIFKGLRCQLRASTLLGILAGALGAQKPGEQLIGQLMRGSMGSIAVKMASTGLNFALAMVLARVLGAEGFGVYSFVFAVTTILAIPAQMGLPNLVVRETAKAEIVGNWSLIKGLWRWASWVALLMSFILLAIGAVTTWLFANKMDLLQLETLLWGGALVPLIALGNLRGAALRGLRKVVQGQLPEFILRPLLLICLIWGAEKWSLEGPSAADAMSFHAAASIITLIIGALLVKYSQPLALKNQKSKTFFSKYWLASTIPLAVIGGSDFISQNSGLIILGIFGESEDVGSLRLAMQFATITCIGISISKLFISPYLVRYYSVGDIATVKKLLTCNAVFCTAASAIPLLALLIFGKSLIPWILGAEYHSVFELTLVLCIGQAAQAFWPAANTLLIMTGREKMVMSTSVVIMAVTLPSLVIAASIWGVYGVAFVTSLSFGTWSFWLGRICRKETGLDVTLGAIFTGSLTK